MYAPSLHVLLSIHMQNLSCQCHIVIRTCDHFLTTMITNIYSALNNVLHNRSAENISWPNSHCMMWMRGPVG